MIQNLQIKYISFVFDVLILQQQIYTFLHSKLLKRIKDSIINLT